jgi:hypothetical protein
MPEKIKWIVMILVVLGLVSVASGALADMIYLPLVINQPTPTSTATLTPTATATPTKTPTLEPGIYIVDIDADPDDGPLDEYVEIENESNKNEDMTDWRLRDEEGNIYYFPDGFTLRVGASVKVWTKAGTDTSGNLYWGRIEPVWNNSHDCAYLRDEDNNRVAQYCY